MTAFQHYELICDAIDCRETYNAALTRADRTRAAAADQGWVHGVVPPNPKKGGPYKSLDYCPRHAEQLGELAPKTLPEHARPVE